MPRKKNEDLSDREKEILAALAEGLTNYQIGRKLFITVDTVKTHLRRIAAKLGTGNRVLLAVWAVTHDLGPAANGR